MGQRDSPERETMAACGSGVVDVIDRGVTGDDALVDEVWNRTARSRLLLENLGLRELGASSGAGEE